VHRKWLLSLLGASLVLSGCPKKDTPTEETAPGGIKKPVILPSENTPKTGDAPKAGDAPKEAALKFARAFEAGDLDGVKAVSISDPMADKALPIMLPALGAMKKLQDAVVEKFGNEGKSALGRVTLDLTKTINDAEVKESGDTATLISKDQQNPLSLKKVDGLWKVELSSLKLKVDDAEIAKQKPIMQAMAKGAEEITKDVKSGKYKTTEEVKTAVEAMTRAATSGPPGPGGSVNGVPTGAPNAPNAGGSPPGPH
jgi:hypothetical protein